MGSLWLEVDEEGALLRRSEEVASLFGSLEPPVDGLARVLDLRVDLRAAIGRRAGLVRFGVGRGPERVVFDAEVGPGAVGAHIVLTRVEALTDQAELGQLLLAHAERHSDAYLVTDPDGLVLWCDPGFCHLVGFERREIIGRHERLYRSPALSPREVEAYWRSLFGTGTYSGAWILRRSDGVDLPVLQSVSAVADAAGRTTHYVGMFRDVSREREVERLRATDLAVRLAGGLCGDQGRAIEELGDRLVAIADRALLSDDPASAGDALAQIRNLASQLGPLGREMGALTRSEEGRSPADLGRVARDLASLMSRAAGPAGPAVTASGPDRGPLVSCGSDDVLRATLHLAFRALDGIADGGVEIVAADDDDDGVLRIRYAPTARERATLRKLFPNDGVTGPIGNELRTRAFGGGVTIGLEEDRDGRVAICVRSSLWTAPRNQPGGSRENRAW